MEVRGTVGPKEAWNAGEITMAQAIAQNKWAGTYQRRKLKKRKGIIRMKYYKPTNPRTSAQQYNRFLFAAGVALWNTLDTPKRNNYNLRAVPFRLSGFCLFQREWLAQF